MKKEVSRPGFIVRLLVVIYDALLLAGVVFFSLVLIFGIALYIFKDTINTYPALKPVISGLVVLVAFLISSYYYSWFWTKGGQTLGMKAWHLYLVDENGHYINRKQGFLRCLTATLSWACFGMGFAWILVNRKNLAWHDMLTKTQIVKYKTIVKKETK